MPTQFPGSSKQVKLSVSAHGQPAGQSNLGANAILAVSMAVCRAGAASMEMLPAQGEAERVFRNTKFSKAAFFVFFFWGDKVASTLLWIAHSRRRYRCLDVLPAWSFTSWHLCMRSRMLFNGLLRPLYQYLSSLSGRPTDSYVAAQIGCHTLQ